MRARVLGTILEQVLAEARGQTAGQRDHAVCVALDLVKVDRRLAAVESFQEACRGELHQVAIAGVACGQQRQVVALHLRGRFGPAHPCGGGGVVVDEIDLTADDRLDTVLGARLVQLHGAVHHTVVGEAQRGLAELRRAGRERVDLARPVEQRVLGVDVQMGAGWGGHRIEMLGGAAAA